ncbi:acetylcholine receptor subunit alpha 1-like [Tropilaelaps mercedesae]|uniref:Acetylcholine receptor subunit alpha 1-like n=1 Tax=Tropilaelaps mercedesae TaxID=418985 RepID=A0A1V9XVK9_9ACAR|nr:acetylcholine receptor subunit alpha 1-like [Tropilaelaps mercedesae]
MCLAGPLEAQGDNAEQHKQGDNAGEAEQGEEMRLDETMISSELMSDTSQSDEELVTMCKKRCTPHPTLLPQCLSHSFLNLIWIDALLRQYTTILREQHGHLRQYAEPYQELVPCHRSISHYQHLELRQDARPYAQQVRGGQRWHALPNDQSHSATCTSDKAPIAIAAGTITETTAAARTNFATRTLSSTAQIRCTKALRNVQPTTTTAISDDAARISQLYATLRTSDASNARSAANSLVHDIEDTISSRTASTPDSADNASFILRTSATSTTSRPSASDGASDQISTNTSTNMFTSTAAAISTTPTATDSNRAATVRVCTTACEAGLGAIICGNIASIAVAERVTVKNVGTGAAFLGLPVRPLPNETTTTAAERAGGHAPLASSSTCSDPAGAERSPSKCQPAANGSSATRVVFRNRGTTALTIPASGQRTSAASQTTLPWSWTLTAWLMLALSGMTPDGIGLGLPGAAASREAKRLFDDLLSDYNRLIRPVGNNSHKVIITVGLKLSQLIDIVRIRRRALLVCALIHEYIVLFRRYYARDQSKFIRPPPRLHSLVEEWEDYKLKWNPAEYGGVDMIHVPAENIWLPDIVLFNNADGNYEVILMNKATVYSTGKVVWKPPALYKSTCEIDVEYFPFDEQNCLMKFASWTYDGFEVDLLHQKQKPGETEVQTGIDMSEFYKSVEWDILLVPAKYNQGKYDCCEEPFPDITFNITMRRKTLFYTVNLIIPCVGISFLTVLVFYLPSDSGEKVTLCISILVSLTVFFLLLAEIIPPTSLAVPLLGKYLLFTMILVTLSISVTVGVLNVHFRSPSTHKMSPWVRRVFIHIMPRLLLMRRPNYNPVPDEKHHKYTLEHRAQQQLLQQQPRLQQQNQQLQMQHQPPAGCNGVELNYRESMLRGNPNALQLGPSIRAAMRASPLLDEVGLARGSLSSGLGPLNSLSHMGPMGPIEAMESGLQAGNLPPPGLPPEYSAELQKAIEAILFIAEHLRKDDEDESERQDWKYVAMVLDRLFLWIFTLACVVGTAGIILQAPSLYDDRESIDVLMSQIGRNTAPTITTANTH